MRGDENDTENLVSYLKAKCSEFNVCAEEAVLLELLVASDGDAEKALRCLGIEEDCSVFLASRKEIFSKQGEKSIDIPSRKNSYQDLPLKQDLVDKPGINGTNARTIGEFTLKPSSKEVIAEEDFPIHKYEAYFSSKFSNEVKQQVNIKRFFEPDQQSESPNSVKKKPRFEKGKTFHIYTPDEIPDILPCSFHLNFLDSELAENLLNSLLQESHEWKRSKFVLFDREVESPHFTCFYADSQRILTRYDYVYNGKVLDSPVPYNEYMKQARVLVEQLVNQEIDKRQRLPYQSKLKWLAEASICNKYVGGSESVGFHSDQLTYIGPQPIIASASLGCEREFRLKNMTDSGKDLPLFSIHLPHNSLIIMHARCQDEWKHSLVPASGASSLTPHPISGQIRINLTYRHYLDKFSPAQIPKCKCASTMILRPVFGNSKRGRYFWTCNNVYLDGNGCGQFKWADFNEIDLCKVEHLK
ncbi:hypothetical protein NADFUDRAFT_79189 [Nadsonia fulvescens var. elongata DSM 6958]|uniref:Uncharacterized protein n=1 Tax=Nadsonia fulvescens var. elongata DSM 6958 TaxID=857566 RepID=A0A1E3PJA5_9ASCO|nr:hypothetical protein NADFUDRAFT_79189 [Nadsonia fulvescens var. elongata DSM 6958]